MPKAYPAEFRRDVVAVARQSESSIAQVAKDFGISESCLARWLQIADKQDSGELARERAESADLRAARRRVAELEQENFVLRQAAAYLSRGALPK